MIQYKILITTSGTGSRLGELTKKTNKALVLINGRPAISYILDSYAEEIPLVITLGYLGDQVKDFLVTEYPRRTFEFVIVDKYIGPGSSLLRSIRCARAVLQCPFIFHACDTIVLEPIPAPKEDWVAGYLVAPDKLDILQYRSHRVRTGYLVTLQDKGSLQYDSIHIGLIGVSDYKKFWQTANELYNSDPGDQSLGDVPVIEKMTATGTRWKWVPFKQWLDTGNPMSLEETENYFRNHKRV